MALSEQERKLLEQLEASLMAEDPKLADTLSAAGFRVHPIGDATGVGYIEGAMHGARAAVRAIAGVAA